MRETALLFLIVATSFLVPVRAEAAAIIGDVVGGNGSAALGQTVNVVSTPQDSEGREAKGMGITKSPAGNYIAPISNVGDRVQGLWVTCINDKEVAQPNYVVFTEASKHLGIHQAKRLILLRKNKMKFTQAEATETINALAKTYELQVWANITTLPKAAGSMKAECWQILQATQGAPANTNIIKDIMRKVHDDTLRKLGKTSVLEEYWKQEARFEGIFRQLR